MSSLAEQRREEVFEAAELANPEWKVDWGLPPAIQQSSLDVMGHIISPDSTYVGLGPDAREFSQESLIDIYSDPVIFAERILKIERPRDITFKTNPKSIDMRKQWREWKSNFKSLMSSTGGPNVTYDVSQPDWEEVVNIYDTIGSTLDSLLSDMSVDSADSMYTKTIRNKLLSGDIHLKGMDPYTMNYGGVPNTVFGFYDPTSTTDTLNMGILPSTRGMMDTFTHELLHGSGVYHDPSDENVEKTGQFKWDKNIDFALMQLFERNPEGYSKIEGMLNEIKDANLNVDWLQSSDTTYTFEDYVREKNLFIEAERYTAQFQFEQGIISKGDRDKAFVKLKVQDYNLKDKIDKYELKQEVIQDSLRSERGYKTKEEEYKAQYEESMRLFEENMKRLGY